jgi:aldose 1-epimerase
VTEPWQVVEIENDHGIRARLANHGARLLELWTRDRDGHLDDVVLGFGTLEEYRARRSAYVGCTIGRVANRIRDARFTLDGITYQLTVNEPPNHLHGGRDASFDDRFWSVDEIARSTVTFRLVSEHLEEGYPGLVRVAVTYTLTDRDELVIDFLAEPDRRTPVSLTNHTYWNLGGHRSLRDILSHELWVRASRYTPSDERLVPTGAIAPVDGTPLDFREPTAVGTRIGELMGQPTRGYDHDLVLDRSAPSNGEPPMAARLRDPVTGRVMELSTTEPALQVYSGQMLPEVTGKHGARYMPFAGLALEPQGFPNAVNEPSFPSVVVEPGAPYRQRSIYRFRTD